MLQLRPKERTLGNILREQAARIPDRVALKFKQQQYTYKQLNDTANRLANAFLELGLAKGDRVCIMLPNSPQFLFVWFGLAKAGLVEVPINLAYKGDLLQYIIEHSGARALVVSDQLLGRITLVQEALPYLERIIVLETEPQGRLKYGQGLKIPAEDFSRLLTAPADEPRIEVINTDLGGLMYTSGTTGPSKGAMMTHNYLVLIGMDNFQHRRAWEDDVFYTCLPLFHANAQGLTTVPALLGGCPLTLGERFAPASFWDEIRAYGATHFNFIGAMLSILWKVPPDPKDAGNPARVGMGAPIPANIHREAEERWGVTLLEGFGLTETGIIAYQPFDGPRPGSFGKAIEHYEVKIFDENDEEVPDGEIGEIVLRPHRPHSVMEGYYKMPEKTLEAFKNLWLHTGDFGRRDADGYLYFVDRKKDAIRRRGENISSFEVERAINAHPAVAESAAVGVPSELSEDEVKIYVVLRPGQNLPPEELMDWCGERMAYFMIPRFVEFVETLPKTPTERVEKYKLRQSPINENTWDREKAGYKIKR